MKYVEIKNDIRLQKIFVPVVHIKPVVGSVSGKSIMRMKLENAKFGAISIDEGHFGVIQKLR